MVYPRCWYQKHSKGFRPTSLRKGEDSLSFAPPNSRRPKLKTRGCCVGGPLPSHRIPLRNQCQIAQKEPGYNGWSSKGLIYYIAQCPTELLQAHNCYWFQRELWTCIRSTRHSTGWEIGWVALSHVQTFFNVHKCLWHHHFHIETHLPPAAKCEIKPFSSLGRGWSGNWAKS